METYSLIEAFANNVKIVYNPEVGDYNDDPTFLEKKKKVEESINQKGLPLEIFENIQ